MSNLDELTRADERRFARRARERLAAADDIIFIDVRPQIVNAAFERDNRKAWKLCKVIAGCGAVLFVIYILICAALGM